MYISKIGGCCKTSRYRKFQAEMSQIRAQGIAVEFILGVGVSGLKPEVWVWGLGFEPEVWVWV